jgi:ABC-type phosphate/phosphonate transport system substrate-binding protein
MESRNMAGGQRTRRDLRRILRIVLLATAIVAFFPRGMTAQDVRPQATTTSEARTARVFRIGYQRGDPEALLSSGMFHAMREALMNRPKLRAAMKAENVDGIILLAADSHQGLIQRMDQNEFDLVFCTSVDFVSQSGDYEALFQLRRTPQDTFDPQAKRVFHRGQIFVNSRSRLFRGEVTTAALAALLERGEIAMVSTFSAAGYVYPCLKLASKGGGMLPERIMFCDSSEEVVKYVINGVTEAGACDAGVIGDVLSKNGLADKRDQLIRVILDTDPIPTDPVALREKWLPRSSVLGRELREELKLFFGMPGNRLPRLEDSSKEKFQDLSDNLKLFRELKR